MTTPTNEAGHGLPGDIIERLAAAKDQLPRGSDERNAVWQAIEYLRTSGTGALSRGVPADMVVVPKEMPDALAESREYVDGEFSRNNYETIYRLLASAPAAAGAQGEVEVGASVSEQDGGSHHCIGGGNWSPWDLFRLSTDMKLPVNLPAEKAMELRRDIERTLEKALAQQTALSSHRQAGEPWTDEQCREFACVAFRHAIHNLPKGVTLEDIRMGASVALALVEKGAGS